MESILKNIARPYLFFVKEGGFVCLIALILASVFYGYYLKIPATGFADLIYKFVAASDGIGIALFKLTVFFLLFVVFYILLKRTFLKILNNPLFNYVSLVMLSMLLYRINPILTFVVAGVGLLLVLYKYLIKGSDFTYGFSGAPFGDSRWSGYHEIRDKGLGEEKGFILGRDEKSGGLIGFRGEGHVLTVAKTGAGKGIGVVIPNLLNYGGSIIVIDPKGENFIRSIHARVGLHQQEIHLIDPFGEVYKTIRLQLNNLAKLEKENKPLPNHSNVVSFYKTLLDKVKPPVEDPGEKGSFVNPGAYNKGLNPMQIIGKLIEEGNYQEIFDQANVIAEMLVIRSANDSDPHWNDKAKMIIKNTIIFLSLHEQHRECPKNLVNLKETILAIFEDEESFEGFTRQCTASEFSGFLDGIAMEFKLMAPEERMSVLSCVLRHLEFIDSPMVNENLRREDFNLLGIKSTPQTIYLVLPANKLIPYRRMMRLWIASIINSISLNIDPPKERILLLLDEMAQLGHMEPLIQAVSLLRGYGLNMWMIFQDIAQIKSIYPADWKTFVSNAKVQQFFGVSDVDTADYVSKLSGTTTVITRNETFSNDGADFFGRASSSQSYAAQERRLLYPDQLYRTNLQFIFTEGLFPIKARKVKFFSDGSFTPGEHLPFQVTEQMKTLF